MLQNTSIFTSFQRAFCNLLNYAIAKDLNRIQKTEYTLKMVHGFLEQFLVNQSPECTGGMVGYIISVHLI